MKRGIVHSGGFSNTAPAYDETVLLPANIYATIGKSFYIWHDNTMRIANGEVSLYNYSYAGKYGIVTDGSAYCTYAAPCDGDRLSIGITRSTSSWLSSCNIRGIRPGDAVQSSKKLLIVGDSLGLVASSYVTIVGNGMGSHGWTLLGTQTTGGYACECYGGLTYNLLLTDDTYPMRHSSVLDIPNYLATIGATPDVVLWFLGINDCYHANPDDPDPTIDPYLAKMDTMWAAWAVAAPNAIMLACTPPPPNESEATFTLDYGGLITRAGVNKIKARMIQRLQSKFAGTEQLCPLQLHVDMTNGYDNAPSGAIHPNALGSLQIGNQMLAFLRWIYRN
jgi:hypothetical protein